LTSVSPTTGPAAGGTLITLTGTNLLGATGVTVGGVAASSVQVINATTVTAVTPAGTAGARPVSVTTSGGTATLASAFSYLPPAPTLGSVSPTSGPTAGGTLIALTGTNLTGATGVTVGGVACTNVQVVSGTTVTAVTPAGTVGAKAVAVTTPSGTASLAGAFTYATVVVPSWATLIEAAPDPAVVTSATLRAAITATGLAWRVKDTATQMEMLLIPPGSFQMGCSASQSYSCESNESPVHTVTLTNAFYLGRYEVTQAQWQARMGGNPSYYQSASTQVPAAQVPNRPVEQVSWNQIAGAGGFMAQTGMRLPTEAEWEYAYRAGTTTAFHGFTGYPNGTNDDTLVGNIAWYTSNSNIQTRPVGGKAANGFGLHDMAGNVVEWVSDWYSGSYYASSPAQNPPGPASGTSRVLRGGSWAGVTVYVRGSGRFDFWPGFTDRGIGFRAARAPYEMPAVNGIAPTSGPTAGGTLITLTGTNLLGAAGVTVGGVAASSVQVINATTVTAVTPAGTAGTAAVAITTPGGTANLPGAFTYEPVVPVWATLIEAQPDPAVVWDADLRAAITATGLAWRVKDTATQMELLLIPPGSFQMGCSASQSYSCDSDENPVHTVTLTQPFYLGRYEVTQAQWQARMGSNPSFFQSPSSAVPADQVPNRPVERVSWIQIAGAGGFMAQTGMRLPTEAEWEYAYRAGTTTAFHGFTGYPNGTNDDTLVGNIAWYTSNSNSQTRPVGGKAGNGFGLHDMSGNVWEWVNDWYSSSYYASSPVQNPPGPAGGTFRVLRGGSCYDSSITVRGSNRSGYTPVSAGDVVGFRAAKAP
jgi:formylglycine-generating enzyme required for sulfatase activity